MTVTAPEVSAPLTRPRRTWRSVALLGGWTVLAALPFVVGIVVPYYGNGLDGLPLAALTSGAHDPKDLPWPTGFLGGVVHGAAGLALAFTPLALIGMAAISGTAAVQEWLTLPAERRARRTVAAGIVAVSLLGVGLLSLLATPTASALLTWRLD